MFRSLRRKGQRISDGVAEKIMMDSPTGVLAVLGDDGYPYTIPLNYVYHEGKIYIHCARTGHKIDSIRRHDKVSFCVVDKDRVVPEMFATNYRSVIAFGRAKEVVGDEEKVRVMRLLNRKYSPGLKEEGEKEIKKDWSILCVIRIDIEHLSGKEAIESVRDHGQG